MSICPSLQDSSLSESANLDPAGCVERAGPIPANPRSGSAFALLGIGIVAVVDASYLKMAANRHVGAQDCDDRQGYDITYVSVKRAYEVQYGT